MQNIKIAIAVFIGTLIILWSANAAFAESPAEKVCNGLANIYQHVAEARDMGLSHKDAASALLEAGMSVNTTIQIIQNVYVDAAGYSPKAIRAIAYEGCMEGMGEAV